LSNITSITSLSHSLLHRGRWLNLFLNEGSYLLSVLLKRPVMAGLPWSAAIEPTTSCNLRCPECPSGLRNFTRPTGNLSLENFRKMIDELSPHLVYLTLYFQGEPFLNRHFAEMVRYAKSHNIYVATSTNGHFLDEETAKLLINSGLDRLIISIDGTEQQTYEKYRRGGNIEIVKQGIANLFAEKKKAGRKNPLVELQFLVTGYNEHQIPDIKSFAREVKADKLTFKSAQVYSFEEGNTLIPSAEKYSRYRQTADGKWQIKSRLPNRCHRLWRAPVITWDGKVIPCCFDKDAEHVMSNLYEQSFRKIWKSPEYRAFREKVFSARKEIAICTNCT
jgi:radical SAM protein with 4Fe4S-binding SPASM domain